MSGKALFWDFDGTLIHPNESFLNSLKKAFKKCNYIIDEGDICFFLQKVCSWNLPEASYTDNTGKKWWDGLFRNFNSFYKEHQISKVDMETLNLLFKSYIVDFKNYVLYDDSIETLRKCAEMGYRNYIISSNFPELPLVIKDLGLSKYFVDYVISSNIGYEKPRKEIFQYALNLAGFPELCYMIGDNPIADIQGGKSIGMKTILVHKEGTHDADHMCVRLSEIPLLLT